MPKDQWKRANARAQFGPANSTWHKPAQSKKKKKKKKKKKARQGLNRSTKAAPKGANRHPRPSSDFAVRIAEQLVDELQLLTDAHNLVLEVEVFASVHLLPIVYIYYHDERIVAWAGLTLNKSNGKLTSVDCSEVVLAANQALERQGAI